MRYILTTVLLGFIACATNRVDLLENNTVSLDIVKPKHIQISASVYEEEKQLLVFGTVRSTAHTRQAIPGHLDIALREPGSTSAQVTQVHLRSMPGPRHHPHPSSYLVRMPSLLKPGSTLVITYHVGEHPNV